MFGAGATGVTVIRSEEVNRVELQLGEGQYTGYLRTPPVLRRCRSDLGSIRATNTFTWAPGVGFVGPYNFVFVRSADGRAASRREVRIVLHPKGRGSVGPQVVIDAPRAYTAMRSHSACWWAVDLDATEGTGVTTLHAWAFPMSGGAPTFWGDCVWWHASGRCGGARRSLQGVRLWGDRPRSARG